MSGVNSVDGSIFNKLLIFVRGGEQKNESDLKKEVSLQDEEEMGYTKKARYIRVKGYYRKKGKQAIRVRAHLRKIKK